MALDPALEASMLAKFHQYVAAAGPIDGSSLGDLSDPSTRVAWPSPSATQAQIDAINAAVQSFDAAAAQTQAQSEIDAQTAKLAAANADSGTSDLADRLKHHTPAQIRSYLTTTVTTLAQANEALARILIYLSRSVS